MDILSGKELQEYLFHIRDLEFACYEQKEYVAYLTNLADNIRHPMLHQKSKFRKEGAFFDSFATGMTVTVFLCAIIGAICVPLFNRDEIGWFFDVIAGVIIGFIGCALIGLVVGIPIGIVWGFRGIYKAKKQSRVIDIQNNNIDAKNREIIADAEKRVGLVQKEISKATSLYNETAKVLDAYYSKDIVYKKYHGLVPITMFCEYFISGRCNTLTGHEGAYNIYENEVRQNIIIAKLDNIINQLESIKQNQYMIADMIQENNREIYQLSKGVEQQVSILQNIENNSAVTNYYSRISAINTSYLSWLAYRNH